MTARTDLQSKRKGRDVWPVQSPIKQIAEQITRRADAVPEPLRRPLGSRRSHCLRRSTEMYSTTNDEGTAIHYPAAIAETTCSAPTTSD